MGNNSNVLQLVDGEQRVIHPYHDYYSAIRKTNYCQIQQPGWTSNAVCSKQPDSKGFCLWHSGKGRTPGTENTSVVSRDWGLRRIWLQRAGGYPWADGSLLYFDHNSMHLSKLTESYTRKVQFYCLQIVSNKKNFAWAWGGTLRLSLLSTAAPDSQSGPFVFSLLQRSAINRREERKAGLSILGSSFREGWVLHSCGSCCAWLHHPCWFLCK